MFSADLYCSMEYLLHSLVMSICLSVGLIWALLTPWTLIFDPQHWSEKLLALEQAQTTCPGQQDEMALLCYYNHHQLFMETLKFKLKKKSIMKFEEGICLVIFVYQRKKIRFLWKRSIDLISSFNMEYCVFLQTPNTFFLITIKEMFTDE